MFCLSFPSHLPKLRISSCFNWSLLSCRFPAFSPRISKSYVFRNTHSHSLQSVVTVVSLSCFLIKFQNRFYCRVASLIAFIEISRIVLTLSGRIELARYPIRVGKRTMPISRGRVLVRGKTLCIGWPQAMKCHALSRRFLPLWVHQIKYIMMGGRPLRGSSVVADPHVPRSRFARIRS